MLYLNRAQRRRLKKEIHHLLTKYRDEAAAEAFRATGLQPKAGVRLLLSSRKNADREWFEAHPRRAHRVRDRFPGERIKGDPLDLPNARISKIIVRQIRPGLRARAAFIVRECEPDAVGVLREMFEMAELRESVATALFEATQNNGRPVQIHDIVAMIEQHESAAARAMS